MSKAKKVNQVVDSAVAAPVQEVAVQEVAPTTVRYSVTESGLASAQRSGLITRQRTEKGHGKLWRIKGKSDLSLRAAALGAILAVADENGHIAQDAALSALGAINLGSKTPATRLSAFVRAELLAIVA